MWLRSLRQQLKSKSEFDGDKALHVENCWVLSILLAIDFHDVVLQICGWFTKGLKRQNLKEKVLLDGLGG